MIGTRSITTSALPDGLGWKTIRIADEANFIVANLKALLPAFMSGLVQSSLAYPSHILLLQP